MRGRTITVSERHHPRTAALVERKCLGSAGPRCNLTGMRMKYWGKDAFVVRIGQYCYRMDPKDFAWED